MRTFIAVFTLGLVLHGSSTLNAQLLNFELEGMSGAGLSAQNEPGDVIDGESGDVGSGGVVLNLATGEFSVDVEWGSGNGYIDLSSDVDFMNIHGPTSMEAPSSFNESSGMNFGLQGFEPSAANGEWVDTISFDDVKGLLEGRYYIHLHTFVNGGGEARGYFIPEVVLGDVNGARKGGKAAGGGARQAHDGSGASNHAL